ncbi:tRNA-(ms[2]io[6]A)-hydroxylase [Halopseudomonas pelagia]|uniref:tRNA-(ms[2]io[6]A)-hydroxylase n=1 Tax=Halopseudomonas pelagia TaxID=553151 RepID=UPI0003AAABCF|nr:tRNA-(ms[2]io[6]A)-hydroxylase [Halopseudomonas pelagia]|tara:strand:- start:230 stop:865 length:636 start_codon:yes stop_codon:yes gene_type:complete
MSLPQELIDFLPCRTPQAWVDQALRHPEELLIDHANCEKKAASTALNLMFRYIDKPVLLQKMSRLAREELRHFEQVTALMQQRGIVYRGLSASHYAQRLRQHIRTSEPGRLVDTLIVGAFIEARSCERFACLAPHLDLELGDFYRSLLKSEARHYQDYLGLAKQFAEQPIEDRIALFAQVEGQAIHENDSDFRFHSGAAEGDRQGALRAVR